MPLAEKQKAQEYPAIKLFQSANRFHAMVRGSRSSHYSGDHNMATDDGGEFIAIGIDFGTMFSAASWASSQNPADIHQVTGWPSLDERMKDESQVPTQLDPRTGKWGFLVSKDESPIRWFKLLILNPDDLQQDLKEFAYLNSMRQMLQAYQDDTGHGIVDLIAKFFKAIWKHTLRDIERYVTVDRQQLRVAVTAPATWPEYARRRLLAGVNKGVKAGIRDHRLFHQTLIGLFDESEAAATYSILGSELSSEVEEGEAFLVCDCGGGIVQVTGYVKSTVSSLVPVKRIAQGKSKLCGAFLVDMSFDNWIKRKLSSEKATDSKFHDLVKHEWEYTVKRTFTASDNQQAPLITSHPGGPGPEICLRLPKPSVTQFFAKSYSGIRYSINKQLKNIEQRRDKTPKKVFLVGGLGASPYLYLQLQSQFQNIVQPSQACSAVVTGAVIFVLSSEGVAAFERLTKAEVNTTKGCQETNGPTACFTTESRIGYVRASTSGNTASTSEEAEPRNISLLRPKTAPLFKSLQARSPASSGNRVSMLTTRQSLDGQSPLQTGVTENLRARKSLRALQAQKSTTTTSTYKYQSQSNHSSLNREEAEPHNNPVLRPKTPPLPSSLQVRCPTSSGNRVSALTKPATSTSGNTTSTSKEAKPPSISISRPKTPSLSRTSESFCLASGPLRGELRFSPALGGGHDPFAINATTNAQTSSPRPGNSLGGSAEARNSNPTDKADSDRAISLDTFTPTTPSPHDLWLQFQVLLEGSQELRREVEQMLKNRKIEGQEQQKGWRSPRGYQDIQEENIRLKERIEALEQEITERSESMKSIMEKNELLQSELRIQICWLNEQLMVKSVESIIMNRREDDSLLGKNCNGEENILKQVWTSANQPKHIRRTQGFSREERSMEFSIEDTAGNTGGIDAVDICNEWDSLCWDIRRWSESLVHDYFNFLRPQTAPTQCTAADDSAPSLANKQVMNIRRTVSFNPSEPTDTRQGPADSSDGTEKAADTNSRNLRNVEGWRRRILESETALSLTAFQHILELLTTPLSEDWLLGRRLSLLAEAAIWSVIMDRGVFRTKNRTALLNLAESMVVLLSSTIGLVLGIEANYLTAVHTELHRLASDAIRVGQEFHRLPGLWYCEYPVLRSGNLLNPDDRTSPGGTPTTEQKKVVFDDSIMGERSWLISPDIGPDAVVGLVVRPGLINMTDVNKYVKAKCHVITLRPGTSIGYDVAS